MDPLEIVRWQFGITTVYHFMMVPLTLGLGAVVTGFYIAYVRTQKHQYKRMTKFWGKVYLINFIKPKVHATCLFLAVAAS